MHAQPVVLLLFLPNSVDLCAQDPPMLRVLSTTCPCDLTMAGWWFVFFSFFLENGQIRCALLDNALNLGQISSLVALSTLIFTRALS